MGFECVMCMETLEKPAPADTATSPHTQQDVNQPGPSTNPENTQEYRSYICATSCGHIFHRVCLNRWFLQRMQKQCPSCRNSLKESNILHIYPPCVSEDLVYQKTLQLTEMESSLPQCDCGSQKCGQLYDIHKTLVSDHCKVLELLQKFRDQSDNKTMLEARVASLEEECARLKLLESSSTSTITAERSENPPRYLSSIRRCISSRLIPFTMRRSRGYSSLIENDYPTPASYFDNDFDDGGYRRYRAEMISRNRMSSYESRIFGFDELESFDEASNASGNVGSLESRNEQETSTASRNLEMNLPASSRPTSNTSMNSEISGSAQEAFNGLSNFDMEIQRPRHEHERLRRCLKRSSCQMNDSCNIDLDMFRISPRTTNASRNLESSVPSNAQETPNLSSLDSSIRNFHRIVNRLEAADSRIASRPTSNTSRNEESMASSSTQETCNDSRNLEADVAVNVCGVPHRMRHASHSSRNLDSLEHHDAQEASTSSNASRNWARAVAGATAACRCSRQRSALSSSLNSRDACTWCRRTLSSPHRSCHTSRYLDSLESRNAQYPNASDYSEMNLRSENAPTANWLVSGSSQGIADVPRNLEVRVPTSTNAPDRVTLSLRAHESLYGAENRLMVGVPFRRSAHETVATRNLESPPAAHSHRHTKITNTHPQRNSGSQTPRSANRFLHPSKETAREYWAAVSNRNSLIASTKRKKEFAAIMRSVFSPQQETPATLSLPLPPAPPTAGTIADSAVEESMPDGPDTPPSLFNNVSENSTISVTSSTSAVVAGNVAQRSGNEPSTSTGNNTQLPSTSSSSTDNSLKSSRPSWVLMPGSINRKRNGHNRRLELKSTAGLPPPRSRASPELEHSTSPATSSNSENLQGERNENSNVPPRSFNITEITLDDESTTDGVAAQAGPSYLASTSESTAPGEKITSTASSGIKAAKVSGSLPSSAKESNNNNRRKLIKTTELERSVNKLGQKISTSDADSD